MANERTDREIRESCAWQRAKFSYEKPCSVCGLGVRRELRESCPLVSHMEDAKRMAWLFLESMSIDFYNVKTKGVAIHMGGIPFASRSIRFSKHALDAFRKAVDSAMGKEVRGG